MKLQGLSIIFGLIVIPMVLVLSYYIQLQVDTITLQTEYDTKLLNSTHSAMAAFELNTANEDLSSVADSLRTIIDASNSIFMNTLATNMGLSNASRSYLEPYIPAVLYTLYDGYYINSPTRKPIIAKNSTGVAVEIDEGQNDDGTASGKFSTAGLRYDTASDTYIYNSSDTNYYPIPSTNTIAEDFGQLLYKLKKENLTDPDRYTTDISDANIEYNIENVLKSYMPYSARYVKGDIDITINYTLDNYLTVVGSIGDCYYTKSGYLIKQDLVSFSTENGAVDVSIYNENQAEEMILAGTPVTVIVDGKKISSEPGNNNSEKTKAVIYYTKAKIFSDWIYNNLGNGGNNTRDPILESDIVEPLLQRDAMGNLTNQMAGVSESGTEEIIYSFEEKHNVIFSTDTDPDNDISTFVNHKYQVIRNSIQYNLNLSMSIYNQTIATTSYDFKMPVISNSEWEKIISNISIVSFMQGLNCGLKTYNNYAIVSSTNNELTVIPSEIFFVQKEQFNNENAIYHRIDCPLLEISETQDLLSFLSKESKYDKLYDKNTEKYLYDHKNLACYTCIIDGNYTPVPLTDQKKLAYYIGLGKERYDIYKMNAIKYSEGYEMVLDRASGDTTLQSGKQSSRAFKEIKMIEVTFGNIDATDFSENIVRFTIPGLSGEDIYVLNTNQAKEQTIIIKINKATTPDKENKFTVGDIRGTNYNTTDEAIESNPDNYPMKNLNDPTTVKNNTLAKAVKAIKIIYK